MVRGIERRAIFRHECDREDFLNRLATILPESQTQCYAWALMKNHVHLLLRSGLTGISQPMRRLLTGYAVYFNHRYRRHGQLFQNRFKSIICQEDVYFKELVRYIHLNPVRGNVVKNMASLNRYGFCGHSALIGNRQVPWQQTDDVLSHFGETISDARKNYLDYIKGGFNQGRRPELTGGGLVRSLGGWKALKKMRLKGHDRVKSDARILGNSEFVAQILQQANEKLDHHYELKILGYDLAKVEERVVEIFGINSSEIYEKGRRRQQMQARSLFCHWAVNELGMSRTKIAKLLGMTQPGVGYAVNRGAQIAQRMNYTLVE
jgi:REP element-mobilizing transposase RayT